MTFSVRKFLSKRQTKKFVSQLEERLKGVSGQGAADLLAEVSKEKARLENLTSVQEVKVALEAGLANNDAAMRAFYDTSHEVLGQSHQGQPHAVTLTGVAVFLLVAGLLYGMWGVFNKPEALVLLGDVSVARGMITFAVTIGTIGIALAMIGANFISQAEDLKERMTQGNQVLTALIAVLGTIVGFYYGISDDGGDSLEEIRVEQRILPEELAAGDAFSVVANLAGGTAPYIVTTEIVTTDDETVVIEEATQVPGQLAVIPLQLPSDLSGSFNVRLKISDAEGNELEPEAIELNIGGTSDASDEEETPPEGTTPPVVEEE